MKVGLFLSRNAAHLSAFISRNRAPVQLVLGTIATALGLWGWMLKDPPSDWSGYANSFFRTLQLITLHFPTEFDGKIPWQLQIARLLVPFVAVLATFNVLIGSITRPLRLALLPHARNHLIVAGGTKMTEQALRALAARGQQIVMISHVDVARREALEGYGLTVVEADARQPGVLEGLNIAKASAVFLTEADDLDNLNLTMMLVQAVSHRPSNMPPLVLAVLLNRDDLAWELDSALDSLARRDNIRYYRLCPDRESLWLDLARCAPAFRKRDHDQASHVLIIGLAGAWEQVLSSLIIATQDSPHVRPVLSFVVDAREAELLARWRAERPELDLVAEFETLAAGPRVLPQEDVQSWVARRGAPNLVVTMLADTEAIAVALSLRSPASSFGAQHTPILVRQSKEDYLLSALDIIPTEGSDFTGMTAFGGLVRAETIERIMDHKGEEAAIALHAHYLQAVRDVSLGPSAAIVSWESLPENLRAANRSSADHAPILFASAGLRIEPVAGGAKPAQLTLDEIERLARVEHRRWMADRIDRRWRAGKTRDDAMRIHPSLRDFDALSASEQEKDRSTVLALAQVLRIIGKMVTRDKAG
jgi:hypothetical protein